MTASPTFLVIGAAKAGTTSLCTQINYHSRVFISNPKEPHYFSRHYDKGWDWYSAHFSLARNDQVIGEGSTSYSRSGEYPGVIDRIARHLPHVKVIYIVRHPVERIESHWAQTLHQNAHNLSLNEAVRSHLPLIDASLYWTQLEGYRRFYPDSQILVLFFEEFKKNPARVIKQCANFLKLDPPSLAGENIVHNPRSGLSRDNTLLRAIRQTLPEPLIAVIPRSAKNVARHFFRRPVPAPNWDKETLIWAVEQVIEDAKKILEFTKRPLELWPLDEKSVTARFLNAK